jgi:hypothetical protein
MKNNKNNIKKKLLKSDIVQAIVVGFVLYGIKLWLDTQTAELHPVSVSIVEKAIPMLLMECTTLPLAELQRHTILTMAALFDMHTAPDYVEFNRSQCLNVISQKLGIIAEDMKSKDWDEFTKIKLVQFEIDRLRFYNECHGNVSKNLIDMIKIHSIAHGTSIPSDWDK